MKISTLMQLGRVSNLPTVWSNVLAGLILSGGGTNSISLLILLAAFTLFYLSGMYLNDAFDRDIDAAERPERPIPSGRITANSVFAIGFVLQIAAIAVLALVAAAGAAGNGVALVLSAAGLAGAIVFYNWHHKENPASPFIMGLCRMLVYIAAAFAVSQAPDLRVYVAAGLLLAYLIGLTYLAKQENLSEVKNLWPLLFLAAPILAGVVLNLENMFALAMAVALAAAVAVAIRFVYRRRAGDIGRAVVTLIAGISLVDAMFIATFGRPDLALLAVAAFVMTLLMQRFISGT